MYPLTENTFFRTIDLEPYFGKLNDGFHPFKNLSPENLSMTLIPAPRLINSDEITNALVTHS